MTNQLIFESRYNGNSSTISARHSIQDFTADSEHVWRHKWHRTGWDYALDSSDNHKNAVTLACRVQVQKDPVSITYGGDTTRGQLWIVTVTS